MHKVADIDLLWNRSASIDVAKQVMTVTNDGQETTVEFGPEVESFRIEAKASTSFSFKVDTYDSEDELTSSSTYTASIGNLEKPLPATNLRHVVVAVREVPDEDDEEDT